jgi:hypothetical protein
MPVILAGKPEPKTAKRIQSQGCVRVYVIMASGFRRTLSLIQKHAGSMGKQLTDKAIS